MWGTGVGNRVSDGAGEERPGDEDELAGGGR